MHFSRNKIMIISCLLLLYISWGSGYLATKIALEHFPPFILAGIRFILAGSILLAFTYARREKVPINLSDIKYALGAGVIMVVFSSSIVAKAQEVVPSGMVAILYGAAPMWFMLGEWLLWGGKKPTKIHVLGLVMGFFSLVWLNVYQGIQSDASLWGVLLILFSTLAWVYGSHASQVRQVQSNLSMFRSSGLVLLVGGVQSLLVGLALGESVSLSHVPLAGYAALAYVTIFSSLIAYTCYLWLLFNSRAIVAISYEYVTPVIALVLGALFAQESINMTIVITSAALLLSVFFITNQEKA